MPRVTSDTEADCFCVCAEMPPISSARSRDTRRISSSACPAASDSLVPSTTPDGALLHGRDRVLRVGLNGLDDGVDLLGRLARAFGEALHFFGDDREAAPRLAGGSRLDRRVQRQHVGLLGDVRDQLHDFADLQRGFAEPLDALGGVLDLRRGFRSCRRSGSAPPGRPFRRRRATAARRAPTAPRSARLR